MTDFWPKRDKDGRHVTAEDTKPKCHNCYDCGYVMADDSGYASVCECQDLDGSVKNAKATP